MQKKNNSISAAQIIAWGSILLGFGVIQGVIYLKSYWGRFGLEPFQFSNASDLAIVGLTGVGVTVVFMMGAALCGGYISHKMERYVAAHRWALLVASIVLIAGLVVLAFLVDFGVQLLIGMLLTWSIVWLAHRSPDLPESIKTLHALPYIALAIAYVPMASHYYGQRRADQVIRADSAFYMQPDLSVGAGLPKGDQRFVGRLGDEYIFYSTSDGGISIVLADSAQMISLRRRSKKASATGTL